MQRAIQRILGGGQSSGDQATRSEQDELMRKKMDMLADAHHVTRQQGQNT